MEPIKTNRKTISTNFVINQSRVLYSVCLRIYLPLLFIVLSCSQAQVIEMADSNIAEFSRKLAIFSINVYSKLTLLKPNENVIFSPFSIQTCGAMARMGAEHKTADELDRGLGLISSDVNEIAESFHNVLAGYAESDVLRIANKIYVKQGYSLREDFNDLLTKKFLSSADEIDFAKNTEAAAAINSWVESKTNNLITNLIPPSALDEYTRMVLVNAVHFKGDWVHKFPKHLTRDEDFYLNESDKLNVKMMNVREHFAYAELNELDAQAVELPYKNSDLSLLVILPNSRTGLKNLEEKLRSVQLPEIIKKLHKAHLNVKLPKFKAEFEIELSDVFQQLGMSRMFGDFADFGKMLKSSDSIQVSKVIHKAIIDVNEIGTEAAAATGSVVRMKRSLPAMPNVEFVADHQFIYILKQRNAHALPIFFGALYKPDEVVTELHDEL